MRLSRNTLLACCLLACLPAGAEPWTVRFDGVGPLRFGMSFHQVNARLGHRLKRTPANQLASEGCDQVGLAHIGHQGMWLMFVDGVFRRVDVEHGARTAAGIGPGDPVQRVFTAYPAVVSAPRPYEEEKELSLTVRAPDGQHAIRFETSNGRVENIFAGDLKEVQWIEGCL